jgi:hypothetical protein
MSYFNSDIKFGFISKIGLLPPSLNPCILTNQVQAEDVVAEEQRRDCEASQHTRSRLLL